MLTAEDGTKAPALDLRPAALPNGAAAGDEAAPSAPAQVLFSTCVRAKMGEQREETFALLAAQ